MALTRCPECAEAVSSSRYYCPHCGFQLQLTPYERETARIEARATREGVATGCLRLFGCLLKLAVGAVFLVILLAVLLPLTTKPAAPAPEPPLSRPAFAPNPPEPAPPPAVAPEGLPPPPSPDEPIADRAQRERQRTIELRREALDRKRAAKARSR